MARGNRVLVTLECKDCKRRNYHTNKNKRTTQTNWSLTNTASGAVATRHTKETK